MTWDAPLTDWIEHIELYTNKEVQQMAEHAFNRVRERTPVRSGRLKAGWYVERMIEDGIVNVVIKNDVEYVEFVEVGTEKFAGVHMLETTLNELMEGVI